MNPTGPVRSLTYSEAIREATTQALEVSEDVVVLGQLVDYRAGVFGTTTGLADRFGTERVQDFPVSEAAMSSVALGLAVAKMRPIIIHQRVDFMMYSLDSIVNWISLWYFKSNRQSSVPLVIRAVMGKGWGQGPQHSKSMHAWFAHLPGLRVAMPSTAYDVKGLVLESVFGETPCLILESRALFSMTDYVPERMYRVRYGAAAIRRPGKDVTIVAIGYMVPLALKAAVELAGQGIEAEVIDPRTISPFDRASVCESVSKTGRLVVCDPGWNFCGFSAEVIATVTESVGEKLKANPARVTQPDSHTPMTQTLEAMYYPTDRTIVAAVMKLFS